MNRKKNKMTVMNVGTSSMLVILIGLSFAVLAALAISTARSDMNLSRELAEHTTEYYTASNRAQEILMDTEELYQKRDADGLVLFSVPINEKQDLTVGICFEGESLQYRITTWKVVNNRKWEGDTSLPVLQEP